jgi:amidohydrolase
MREIRSEVLEIESDLINLRRELHKIPEVAYKEFKTSKLLKSILEEHGVSYQEMADTGIVVTLGQGDGNAVLVRADMDALPVTEEVDVEFRSTHKGFMHACGHDSHMAMLMMALLYFKKHEDSLKRPVKFMFQPAEEGGAGAEKMLGEGVLKNPDVVEGYACHISNRLPTGFISAQAGVLAASCDEFEIKITGRGGHGAKPHSTIEPMMIAARLMLDCQHIISREINAMESNVLSFTTIHSGSKFNVIDDVCIMGGTLRTRREQDRTYILKRLDRKFKAYELDYDCKIELIMDEGYPSGSNDSSKTSLVREVARDFVGEENLYEHNLGLGAEDFAWILNAVPGCYFLVGAGPLDTKKILAPSHSSKYTLDEAALKFGVEMWISLIEKLCF